MNDSLPTLPARCRDTDGTIGTLYPFDAFAYSHTFAPVGVELPAIIGPGIPHPYRHLSREDARRLVFIPDDEPTAVMEAQSS